MRLFTTALASTAFFALQMTTALAAPAPANIAEKSGDARKASRIHDVTVFADASLTIPLTKIARRYSSEKQLSVSAVFSSTKEQLERIEDGEEAHLFISAKPSWIKRLQQQGLIDVYSRTNIASNRLIIAGPEENTQPHNAAIDAEYIRTLLPTNTEDFQFALGDPEYLAEGTYGFQALQQTGLNTELEPYYYILKSSHDIFRATQKYGAYSAVLKTDAMLHPDLNILSEFPPESHDPIIYQAVVVAGENMDGARKFLSYLQSDEALEVLTNYGFGLTE